METGSGPIYISVHQGSSGAQKQNYTWQWRVILTGWGKDNHIGSGGAMSKKAALLKAKQAARGLAMEIFVCVDKIDLP